jgi:hypothetical protein
LKTYLKAILPFYIWAGIKFFQMLIFPIILLLSTKWDNPELMLTLLPYAKLLSTVVNISAIIFIIWTGFRTARAFNGSIWISATTGVSYYLFSVIFLTFIVLTIPLIQILLWMLILGVSASGGEQMNYNLLKTLFTPNSIKSVAMWTLYGTIGGTMFNVIASRKKQSSTQVGRL